MPDQKVERVLLVDDNDTDNFISKRIIEIAGFAENIEVENSGKAALDRLHEEANTPDLLPNIIFLDINMPIVDGFVFLYEFEKYPDVVKEKCKIVILSSSDNERDIDQIMSNDKVITFITKPLTSQSLEKVKEFL
ncbi:response regulator [Persicobacter psychrovividus]|uniref:Response regulator n=1 Tax=Persicobacter psychrovividus TaxID=387638 RepID=A0ABM7VBU7_9BACT|nr:response regulator [Persicobacter psychrovividus]